MSHQPPPCPTGKHRYRSETTATHALHRIWSNQRPGRRLETRVYACTRCDGWHLTSKAAA